MKRDEMTMLAAATGHAAAQRAAAAFYGSKTELDSHRWASFGEVKPFAGDDSGEAAVQALGAYVATYHEAVPAEQLYRKAAELGIHRSPADGWLNLTDGDRLPYVLFGAAARAVAGAVVINPPEAVSAPPVEAAAPAGEKEEGGSAGGGAPPPDAPVAGKPATPSIPVAEADAATDAKGDPPAALQEAEVPALRRPRK